MCFCNSQNRCNDSKKKLANFNDLFFIQVQKICNGVSNTTDHHEIQRNIRLLSICCQILESFNTNVEMLMSSLDEDIFNEVLQTSPNSVCLRVKDWLCDLSSYQIGDSFTGYVSYVLDNDKKLCFVKDLSKFVQLFLFLLSHFLMQLISLIFNFWFIFISIGQRHKCRL